MKKNRYDEAEHYMVKLFNLYVELGRRPYEYCEGISLYPNEIHAVEYIATSSTTNQTDLSANQGITRGAVSKMVSKLEGMGLLRRYKYYPNQKEIYLHLTELGIRAYEGHKAYHADMWQNLSQYFAELDEEHQNVILEFLRKYDEQMQKL